MIPPAQTARAGNARVDQAVRLLRQGQSPGQARDHTGCSTRELAQAVSLHKQDAAPPAPADPAGSVPDQPAQAPASATITSLPVALLRAHPGNIRADLGDLTELAATIREHGVLQPLLVRSATTDGHQAAHMVVDGHRRLAAAHLARLTDVPVRVLPPSSVDQHVDDVVKMLVTGLTKRDLDPLEEADAYAVLINDHGLNQEQVAKLVGKNSGMISARLALTRLTETERQALRDKQITVHQAVQAGAARSPGKRPEGQQRPKPRNVPHFTREHPAAMDAALRCDHEVTLKLTVACGPCWEAVLLERARDGWTRKAAS